MLTDFCWGNLLGSGLFGRLRRFEVNIKMDFREAGYECGEVYESGSGSCPVSCFGISSVKPLGSAIIELV
jgi:hypothetical protein